MNTITLIMSAVMLLTLLSPYVVYKAIRPARKKDYRKHRKYQNIVFFVCMGALFLLEGLIKFSGGSGSLTSNSNYADRSFFKIILTAHIIGAVLTYALWLFLIVFSNFKFRKTLPGSFSKLHKTFGIITFVGLMYSAVSALVVYLLTLNLI